MNVEQEHMIVDNRLNVSIMKAVTSVLVPRDTDVVPMVPVKVISVKISANTFP